MAEKGHGKYSENLIKTDKIIVKIIGVIKAAAAAIYAILFAVILANGDVRKQMLDEAGKLDLGGISPEVAIYCVMGGMVLINVLYAIFCFRATKSGASAIPLLVISLVAFFYSELTTNGGGIFSGNFSLSYVVQTIINLGAFGCAIQLQGYNKQK